MYTRHTATPLPRGTKDGDMMSIRILGDTPEDGVEDYPCEWVDDEAPDGYWAWENRYGEKSFYPDELEDDVGAKLCWMELRHCCGSMQQQVEGCHKHPEGEACPDITVLYDAQYDRYSLPHYQGIIVMKYCPWCAADRGDRMDQWWAQIEKLLGGDPGFEEVAAAKAAGKIPDKFLTDEWWRNPSE